MSLLTKKLPSFCLSKLRINGIHSNASLIENCTEVENRNPRNLELMRIARKPRGYSLDKTKGASFWHQLVITRVERYVNVSVEHVENGAVITASSKEWPLKKRLYAYQDRAAYINLGRVLAERCLESGIHAVHIKWNMPRSEKINALLAQLKENGLALREPIKYINVAPWDLQKRQKSWEVTE